jgi:hypothetical protein
LSSALRAADQFASLSMMEAQPLAAPADVAFA